MNKSGAVRVVVGAYPATGETITVPIQGMLVGVGVNYNFGSVYSTALDLSITGIGDNEPDQDILAISGGNSSGWFYPVAPLHDQSGGVIADQYTLGIPVFGNVEFLISNAQPGDSVDFTIMLL